MHVALQCQFEDGISSGVIVVGRISRTVRSRVLRLAMTK